MRDKLLRESLPIIDVFKKNLQELKEEFPVEEELMNKLIQLFKELWLNAETIPMDELTKLIEKIE